MKRTIFTVIVAVFAAAFFMVGNSPAEGQVFETCDSTIAGTGIISGVVTDAKTGAPLAGVYVSTSMGTSATTNQGVYVMLCPAGRGTIYFQKAFYYGIPQGFRVCAGEVTELNASMTPMKTTTTTSVAGCVP